jgi:hypothetical protein
LGIGEEQMTAHTPNGPAHDSTPPIGHKGMSYLNIDKTGVSMSPKTVVGLIAFIIFLVSGWFAFLSVNATKADIVEHNSSTLAHQIVLRTGESSVPVCTVVKDNHKAIKEIPTIKAALITVRNGFYEERAERLADRAADKIKGEQQSRERWQQVRARAIKNLEQDKPIRDGLEDYL